MKAFSVLVILLGSVFALAYAGQATTAKATGGDCPVCVGGVCVDCDTCDCAACDCPDCN